MPNVNVLLKASSCNYIDPNGNLEWDQVCVLVTSDVRIIASANVNWYVLTNFFQASVAPSDFSSSTHLSGAEKTRCQGTNKDGSQCKRMTSKALCPTHRRTAQNKRWNVPRLDIYEFIHLVFSVSSFCSRLHVYSGYCSTTSFCSNIVRVEREVPRSTF